MSPDQPPTPPVLASADMVRPSIILALGLIARLIIAGYIAYLGPDAGFNGDVQNFYLDMIFVAKTGSFLTWEIGASPVVNSIGAIMGLFGDSVIVACLPACIAWWFSGLLFAASARMMQATSRQMSLFALAYAFWPTTFAYTAIPLRESFQMLFISLATWGMLRASLQHRLNGWAAVAAGVLLAGSLHGALAAYAPVFGGIAAIMASTFGGKGLPVARIAIGLAVAIPIIYLGASLFQSTTYDLSGGALQAIQKYQEGGLLVVSRADYKISANVGSGFERPLFLMLGLVQYLFEPFPQRISSLADGVLAIENLVRAFLILATIRGYRALPQGDDRRLLLLLALLYIAQEAIWSVGTVNWGTAARHHLPAMGLLLLAAMQAGLFRGRSRRTGAGYAPITTLIRNAPHATQ